jgi:hypothetical protein
MQAQPTIIEDNCFIGVPWRTEVPRDEGVWRMRGYSGDGQG